MNSRMSDNSDYFISLDVGTTAVKVAVFDGQGNMPALSTKEYSLYTPAQDIVELDPQTYWKCCKDGINDVLAKSKIPPGQIKSVGICSQGETLIVLDKQGRPLRNAIVWIDNRSAKEAEELKSVFGTENNTGQTDLVPTWPITKILWLRKNQPDIYSKIHKFLLVEDYIIYRLTGQFKGEYSLYTSSFMLDIVNKKWWKEILDYVGVSTELLVDLCESGEIIGNVSSIACKETGLAPGTKVVTGAMDQTAAMIGAGNIKNGIVTETTGAALAVCGTIKSFPVTSGKRSIAIQYHAIPDNYVLIGWCPTGGMAFKWLRDTFFAAEKDESARSGKVDSTGSPQDVYDYMTGLAEKIPAGSQGLIFLPYLAGPGTADIRPDARGVFYGLELHHSRAHFARAVMEATGLVLRQNIDEMERLGLACKEVRSLGGGSKSRLWNQIKADILGRPVITMNCAEAASLGTAVLQAKAVGTYRSFEEAVDNMVQLSSVVEPDKKNQKAYEPVLQRFFEINRKCF